jgi:UDP:flavonoid glycosyltransferase YjiC (YdhE family)
MENNVRKIFVLPLPDAGHVLPVASVVSELAAKNPELKIIFYGIEKNRETILKTGAEFRLYNHPYYPVYTPIRKIVKSKMQCFMDLCYDLTWDFTDHVLPQLLADFDRDQPDMVIYDTLALHTKYLLNSIENRYKRDKSSVKPPLTIMFQTTFAQQPNIYPNDKELDKHIMFYDFWYYVYFLLLLVIQLRINWKFGTNVYNMPKLLLDQTEKKVLATIYPEFQPKRELFDNSYTFVGSCLSENVRKSEITDETLKNLLDSFEPGNPLASKDLIKADGDKLVYASLGTTFNNNIEIFEKIIEAFRFSDTDFEGSKVKPGQIKVLVATGKEVYAKFQEKIKTENFVVPANVLLHPFVPQLDVLARASLFITHAGMNSASEAIRYAVPVVCLPLFVDQPLVAVRLVDELKLGKRYEPTGFKPVELRRGVIDVLNDDGYVERMIEFSRACMKHTGVATSCGIIVDHLNSRNNKKND